MVVVLYHSNCCDGFGAAWAAWKRLGDGAQYIPVSYGQPPPELANCEVLYILDFSYPPGILADLHERIPHITLLDHHVTARADLAGVGDPILPSHIGNPPPGLFIKFDMSESGASLAWTYFHYGNAMYQPLLIRYVKDRDLWLFRQPDSKKINAWLRSYPFGFALWDRLNERLAGDDVEFTGVCLEGEAILRSTDQQVAEMAKHMVWANLGGYLVPCVNATVYFSEVGDYLCKQFPEAPFSVYYFDCADGNRQWGLRSRGSFDVNVVAKLLGGGGHRNAAGFVTKVPYVSCKDVDSTGSA